MGGASRVMDAGATHGTGGDVGTTRSAAEVNEAGDEAAMWGRAV
jgi:hypothetical protein